MARKLFVDPDGDGQGEWSAETTTTIDLTQVIAYIDARVAAILESPKFTGVPEVPTAAPASSSKQAANTEYVDAAATLVQNTIQSSVESAVDTALLDTAAPLCYVFKTSNPSAARPAIPSYGVILWDLPGTTPPVNMGADDMWIS